MTDPYVSYLRLLSHGDDVEDHYWEVAGLAPFGSAYMLVSTGAPDTTGISGQAVVLACACGRSRWIRSRPTVIEEPPA